MEYIIGFLIWFTTGFLVSLVVGKFIAIGMGTKDKNSFEKAREFLKGKSQ